MMHACRRIVDCGVRPLSGCGGATLSFASARWGYCVRPPPARECRTDRSLSEIDASDWGPTRMRGRHDCIRCTYGRTARPISWLCT
eukprot:scaffold34465_cov112-Isochrysis_galbana.AAC.2